MYHLSEAYAMATFICLLCGYLGALTFASIAVPRLVVKHLDKAAYAPLLSMHWRSVHKLAVIGGLAFTAVCALASGKTALPNAYALMLVSLSGLMSITFYVSLQTLPTLSESPDGKLKFSNIILVFTGILTGIVLIAALVYVLPGQFTFWPTAQ
jgi:hypothetical protein|tara:strand:- start:93 stop:554 length:462 start_codon:yes stop_codon:yes gene_type:complete